MIVPAVLAVSVVFTQQLLTGGEHPENTLKRSLHSIMPDGTESTGVSQKKVAPNKRAAPGGTSLSPTDI